ncbi:hypothetical protein AB1Y20_015199 [Prymnesium parvum]|uniref:Uncharacterized protein n=1 Tax=Prymnesium parvum TaxID=97485 RepID=A0AB34JXS0_PRYPA
MGDKQLQKLKAAGVIGQSRAVRILAAPAGKDVSLEPNQLLVHLQRHGQGFHNLVSDYIKQHGVVLNSQGGERAVDHPYRLEEMVDPPLTDKGREQCKAQQPTAAALRPQAVLVSPLCRAIQTALFTFSHVSGKVPFVTVEELRETIGQNTCDKRRARSDLECEYGHLVDLSRLQDDKDVQWTPDHRESPQELVDRIYMFMLELRSQANKEVAVVGHSGWLLAMLSAVCDCSAHPHLATWFETCEIRSVVLTYEDEKQVS